MNWRPFKTSKGILLIRRKKTGHLFNNSLMFLSITFMNFGTATSSFCFNQQLNFNFNTHSSLLAMIHASVKNYRAALFAFPMNILISIRVILRGHLPMSLVPTESLLAILRSVAMQQTTVEDRLAIPMSDLLSYFDSKLLADAITVTEGLLITLNNPLASKQTVSTVFEAKLIPTPYPDDTPVGSYMEHRSSIISFVGGSHGVICPLCRTV